MRASVSWPRACSGDMYETVPSVVPALVSSFGCTAVGASEEEAREYSMRWGLTSPTRAGQSIRFVTDPVWGSYVSTYTDGYKLCREFVGGDQAKFKRLLTEQLTPAELVGEAEK